MSIPARKELARQRRPIYGAGIGLRSRHITEILSDQPDIPWLELLADNHLVNGGRIQYETSQICEQYPVTFHSVGMSLGSTDPLNIGYVKKLKKFMRELEVSWLSEHLCFTSFDGIYSHDLLPVPYTYEACRHMADRISQVQDIIGEPILVENVSSYLSFKHSEMQEVNFLNAVVEEADCYMLVDVNNIYVNHINNGIDPLVYIDGLSHHRIKEIHLAGFEKRPGFILDAHNQRVAEPVWQLYRKLVDYVPDVPTLIEWDNDVPELQVLLDEAYKAESIHEQSEEYVMLLTQIESVFINLADNKFPYPDKLRAIIRPIKGLNADACLDIYRGNIIEAHQKTLKEIYPACRNILGEAYFRQLCRKYIILYPSAEPDLNQYGEQFPLYIQDCINQHAELMEFSYLYDLASLEWHWHASFYTENAAGFDFKKLEKSVQSIDNDIVFKLNPSLTVHSSHFPVIDIWVANRNIPDSIQDFALPEHPVYYCIYRKKFEPIIVILNEDEYRLISDITLQLSFSELAEKYAECFQAIIVKLVDNGWITDISGKAE